LSRILHKEYLQIQKENFEFKEEKLSDLEQKTTNFSEAEILLPDRSKVIQLGVTISSDLARAVKNDQFLRDDIKQNLNQLLNFSLKLNMNERSLCLRAILFSDNGIISYLKKHNSFDLYVNEINLLKIVFYKEPLKFENPEKKFDLNITHLLDAIHFFSSLLLEDINPLNKAYIEKCLKNLVQKHYSSFSSVMLEMTIKS